ncbi:MAG: hypothetical protein KDB86_01005 [Actinobacteria bacterium]|nr:hypothetical protein [Actinomycetota bacterium]
MAANDTTQWLLEAEFPEHSTPQDLYSFFGIPPDPAEDLERNIREKRKVWRKKSAKGRSSEAKRLSAAVLQAIDEAEDALLRGAEVANFDRPEQTTSTRVDPRSIESIWAEIETLLYRGRYQATLERLDNYGTEWSADPRFRELRSTVILDIAQTEPQLLRGSQAVADALKDARRAIAELGPSEPRFLTLIDLYDAVGEHRQADQAFAEAMQKVEHPSAVLRARQLKITARDGDISALLRVAIDLVRGTPDDRGLRSESVQAIMEAVTRQVLPVRDETTLVYYKDAVAVASWIADGVPEAENFMRPHRMWAANVDQRIFSGNWQWRALGGILSGFLLLPLINRAFSKPGWKILLDGPAQAGEVRSARRAKKQDRTYFLVMRNNYVKTAHAGVKLPWQAVAGHWIEIDPTSLFDF